MRSLLRLCCIALVASILFPGLLPAQSPEDAAEDQAGPPAAASAPAKTEQLPAPVFVTLAPWGPRLKPISSWLSLGADFRLRAEYHDNVYTLNSDLPNHEYNYQKYRLRFAATVSPSEYLDVNVRLTSERRLNIKPDESRLSKPDEIIFDTLNFSLKKPWGLPVTLTVGRQDIAFGTGWIIRDGTPGDGARTLFFDAARLTWDLRKANTTVDLIGIGQASNPEAYLPVIHAVNRPNVEQRENGAIAYVSHRARRNLEVNGYFIFKHDSKVLANGDYGNIYAYGGSGNWQIDKNWRYSLEGALQRGDKNGRRLHAYGEIQRLTYSWNNRTKQKLILGHEYMSGDDPGSKGVDESWDVLWGRWPQWSELMVSNYSRETRQSEITNLQRLDFGWGFSPTRRLDLTFDYMPLFAPDNPICGKAGFSCSGSFRGNFVQAIGRFKISDYLSAHLWGEVFVPGNYYVAPKQDPACFLRFEFVVRW